MQTLRAVISEHLSDSEPTEGCACTVSVDDDRLEVDATACDGGGHLERQPACRATVIRALEQRDIGCVRVVADGVERRYEDGAAALLVAAGRFAEQVRPHDERLSRRTCREPLAGAREATGRADAVADIAATTGLAELAARADDIESALSPVVGLRVSDWQVDTAVPSGVTLAGARTLETGATVRRYDHHRDRDQYFLTPLECTFSAAESALLTTAFEHIAAGEVEGGDRALDRAIRAHAPHADQAGDVRTVLRKHTLGHGLLEDFFADPQVSDVFVSAPADENPVRVRVDGEILPTNVHLSPAGVRALASRFRRESGRGFSTADPTLDAGVQVGDRQVRVAGVREPVSDGIGFTFRAHDQTAWTLPALVANDTLTSRVAALLSIAVERGRSLLLAGPRGAGKTTMLAALLWELPPPTRTVVIEDSPELPVDQLQDHGRDVQALRAGQDTAYAPADALHTALRLGNGALVVGEVRGEEAAVLYEAMRVGANSEAVLGTIHGERAAGVYDRVVSDLGVDPTAFDATDLVVTLEIAGEAQSRRIGAVEEVVDADAEVFNSLFDRPDGPLVSTGRIDRGNSRFVGSLAGPTETYEDVRRALSQRQERIETLVAADKTTPGDVSAGHAHDSVPGTESA